MPWKMSDAPRDYLDKLLRSIVGISIQIDRVEAKFKMSQNQPRENIESLIAALALGIRCSAPWRIDPKSEPLNMSQ